MNNPRRLKKSSDEVRVKLIDSDKPEDKYWDLEERYTYRDKRNIDHKASLNSSNLSNSSKTSHYSSKSSSKNQISIQFDLDETRQMTQDQKQAILNTLIAENSENNQTVEEKTQYRNLIPENGLIPLIALLAFLTFFSIILLAALTAGPYHYY